MILSSTYTSYFERKDSTSKKLGGRQKNVAKNVSQPTLIDLRPEPLKSAREIGYCEFGMLR